MASIYLYIYIYVCCCCPSRQTTFFLIRNGSWKVATPTPLKLTASLPLKINAWKMMLFFWHSAYFQRRTVTFPETKSQFTPWKNAFYFKRKPVWSKIITANDSHFWPSLGGLLMEEILHHLLSMKPYEKWDMGYSPYQLVSRISSINSITLHADLRPTGNIATRVRLLNPKSIHTVFTVEELNDVLEEICWETTSEKKQQLGYMPL